MKKLAKKKAPPKRAPKKASPKKKASRTPVKSTQGVLANHFDTLTEIKQPGKFIIIYGPPGLGKTTVAAHAKKPLFVFTSDEQGIIQALQAKVVPEDISNYLVQLDPVYGLESIPKGDGHPGWIKCIDTMKLFEGDDHDRETLVIDTASGLQNLCFQHCASILYDGDMVSQEGFMNFYAGYIKSAEQFWQREFIRTCTDIVATGKDVILLAHSNLSNQPNPSGPEFQIYSPDLDKRIWNFTKKSVHGIFFMGIDRRFTKDVKTKKTKVKEQDKFIGVTEESWYEAKNWFNLSDDIECGSSAKETWANLSSALNL